MSTTVAVPLWLAVLIAVLAGLALLDLLLVPSARWFLRSRANKVLDEVGSRLKIQIRPFQQSSRRALIDRLVYDDKVQQATRQFAATQRMPGEVAMHIARCAPRKLAYYANSIAHWLPSSAAPIRPDSANLPLPAGAGPKSA